MTKSARLGGYAFIAPAVVIVLAVSIYPLLYQLYLSFTDWYLLSSPDPIWQGIDGYRRLVEDSKFWSSLWRTIYWTVGTVAIEYLIAMPLALLLHRRFRLNGIFTGLILLPWVTPTIVIAYTWRWMFDSNYGVVHEVLNRVGLVGERSILSDPDLALPALTFVSAWKGAPFMTVALLAAMKAIPAELYEAASIDGANAWRRFRDITFPMVKGVSVVMCLILGILAFYSFDIVWVITKGGPIDSTTLVGVYLFRMYFERLEISYAATIGVSMLLLLALFSTVYLKALHRPND